MRPTPQQEIEQQHGKGFAVRRRSGASGKLPGKPALSQGAQHGATLASQSIRSRFDVPKARRIMLHACFMRAGASRDKRHLRDKRPAHVNKRAGNRNSAATRRR